MMWLVPAVLLLAPVLDTDTDLRLVATGTGDDPVEWHLDGERVAVTFASEAAVVPVAAGTHELRVVTPHTGSWDALARPDGATDGADYVDGWWAQHPGTGDPGRGPWLPLGLAATAFLLLLARPKRP